MAAINQVRVNKGIVKNGQGILIKKNLLAFIIIPWVPFY